VVLVTGRASAVSIRASCGSAAAAAVASADAVSLAAGCAAVKSVSRCVSVRAYRGAAWAFCLALASGHMQRDS